MRTIIKERGETTRRYIDLGIKDDRGREIGLAIWITPCLVEESPDTPGGYNGGYNHIKETGWNYALNMQVTRNRNCFGACQPADYHKLMETVEAAIEDRAKSMKARYAKKFS